MATNGCKNFLGRLDSWIEGERPAEAKAHLRDCASCQTVIEDLSAIQIEARSWNQLESEAPERVWTALRAQLEQEGLVLLQKAVGTERRPLSWVVGPQGVERPPMPSLRDLKREFRQKTTNLRPTDEV